MRNQETTKHDYGHALLVAGGYGHMGCAILAARAALRSGCGLLTVHLPSYCVAPMQAAFPEAMVSVDTDRYVWTSLPVHTERYSAIAVGPGLGTDEPAHKALRMLLKAAPPTTPMIVDADAINIIATDHSLLDMLRGSRCILTPHDGEYRRLFGDADPAVMAAQHELFIIKKAHRTRIYAPDGRVHENDTGNAGMATAGSGDVLTGILLGVIAQNVSDLFEKACLAVHIHGKIGDIAVCQQSESSLIASDMVERLKDVSVEFTVG